MLFSFKLSKDTLNSLIYPIPCIIAFIGSCFAPMLILNCMTSCIDENEQLKQAIGSVFAVFGQINSINQALPSSIVMAFLSTGNHAFGSKNMKRLKKLLFWTLLITIVSGVVFSLSVVVFKNKIARWFIKNEFELKVSSKMLPIPFYTSFLYGIGVGVYSLILIVKKPILAMIPFIVQILILSCGSEVFKLLFKNEFVMIFHVYNCADIICFIIYIVEFVYAIKIIRNIENQ